MTQSVESLAAELAAMRAISRTVANQTAKLDAEASKRVLAWLKATLETK